MPPRWIKPGDERWSNSQERSKTMQDVAERLRCPCCKRRSGLKEYDHAFDREDVKEAYRRRCRWCGYADTVERPWSGPDRITVIQEGSQNGHAKR